MVTQGYYLLFLAVIAAERGIELILSARHARWSFARGGVEVGRRHFVAMKALHSAFFVAAASEVIFLHRPWILWIGFSMLVCVGLAQALRYWAISTLGARWNTRIIVVPGLPAVTGGPYRWVRHPNYIAVFVEGLAIPLVHSAYLTAAVFTLLNAVVLAIRIRCEEKALGTYCDYDAAFGGRSRLLPGKPLRHASDV